ncbi:uncharacterized protein LOC121639328 [Melanotaenia boesemani]|uniref:uncharacterized protein LOC121639328 n=1 Tax=Melanotaenia boesemani TaxID=1250792 RepID=UPI001C03B7BF|nr:uncharacterized protein LOC121639328 [Melanotaenia boesemani]
MNGRQRMKLLLSSLLLTFLCAHFSQCVSSDTIVVKQTPDVSVQDGETINITCCWTENIERTRVYWLKNQIFIKNETNHKPQESLNQQEDSCSTLIFPNITRNDSGRYICRVNVEIPVFKDVEGNGTIITVTSRENKDDNTDHHKDDGVFIFVLRCLLITALFSSLLLFQCWWTKTRNTSAASGSKSTPLQRRDGDQQEHQEHQER